MSSRTWQMLAAAASIAVMIFVLVKYGLRDDAPAPDPVPAPTRPMPGTTPLGGTLGSGPDTSNEPHQGAEHHTAEVAPHEGGKPSPLDVYANAKVGDWHAYESVMETSMAPKPVTVTTLVTITAIDAKQITRTLSGPDDPLTEQQVLPRQGLTLDQLTGNDARGWTIHEVAVTDEPHDVGGRSFKAKKISFGSRKSDEPNRFIRSEVWFSDEVPAGGLVEHRDLHEGADFKLTRRVIGFGDAKKTRWGKKPLAAKPSATHAGSAAPAKTPGSAAPAKTPAGSATPEKTPAGSAAPAKTPAGSAAPAPAPAPAPTGSASP